MVNTKKNLKRTKFMTNSIRGYASENNMGKMATEARIHMLDTNIIPAILHGSEAYPSFTKEEMNELEKMQGSLIRDLLEISPSTPYMALLWELGIPTMKARISYRKLMLYHNLNHSDERRIAKKVMEAQIAMDRESTWLGGIYKLLKEYNIENTVQDELKSQWKKKVKIQLQTITEEEIKKECTGRSKARTTLRSEYKMKDYLRETGTTQSRKILSTRLHMTKIPCNYKKKQVEDDGEESCWLCGLQEIRTEHFFLCKGTKRLREIWSVKEEDLISESTSTLKRVAMFMEKVETMYSPKWEAQKVKIEDEE